ncbi:MAG: hypothetical protein PHU85_02790 [Phycisphaerae bacterium]|nr:hypothetical protein [Phycisphaerae bacterium]
MNKVNTGHVGGRPTVFGRRGGVSSGHYLASEIGNSILRRGGNAADAAAVADAAAAAVGARLSVPGA